MGPTLYPVTGGGFEATCGKCLGHSVSVPAADAPSACAELLTLGWSLYKPRYGVRSYALCPACTKDPPDVEKDAAAARRSRKRK